MAFDIGAVLKDMVAAATGVLSSESPKVKGCLKKAIEDEKKALEKIAKARLDGKIDGEDMKTQIADEKDTLKASLLACAVVEKLALQKATNAALKVFSDAVKVALKAAL